MNEEKDYGFLHELAEEVRKARKRSVEVPENRKTKIMATNE
ncbi:MAG TPA: hypothetical protein VI864_02550 [Candidatus Bathyarchaeia archaeon]|nr:hypothetical protein [Candidatus Bathyarchaeia archaeon]